MKNLLDKIFPTLSDELIIVISLIIGLLVTASLILFLVKKISPKTNISELAARTRSWWIMAGMFIGAVFISYNISYFFLAFLSFIAFRELYSVLGSREADRRCRDRADFRNEKIDEYNEKFMNPSIASMHGYVDEIIKPEATRERVYADILMLADKRSIDVIHKKHGNIPL